MCVCPFSEAQNDYFSKNCPRTKLLYHFSSLHKHFFLALTPGRVGSRGMMHEGETDRERKFKKKKKKVDRENCYDEKS